MKTIKIGSKGEEVKILQNALNLVADGVFGNITREAVVRFQSEHGLVADGIVGDKTWSLILSNWPQKSKRFIKEIIVHCTATAEGKDFTVEDITRWHKREGYGTIGYHYVVYRDGSVHEGRKIDLVGAHTIGHNTNSIGVCYVGGCAADGKTPKDTRTEAQKRSLVTLLTKLKTLYPNAKIYGHRDFARKACPSFDATNEYKNI